MTDTTSATVGELIAALHRLRPPPPPVRIVTDDGCEFMDRGIGAALAAAGGGTSS
ncbi:hypothetical protein [Actinophytocola sediminis]